MKYKKYWLPVLMLGTLFVIKFILEISQVADKDLCGSGSIVFIDSIRLQRPDLIPDFSWSPDGKSILFRSDSQELYIFHLGEEPVLSKLANTTRGEVAWHPTGDKVVFVKIDGEQQHIQILDLQSEAVENVNTTSEYDYDSPQWSPDGQNFTYVRQILIPPPFALKTKAQIYLQNPLFSNRKDVQLTHKNNDAFSPTWSPDSMRIAYIQKTFSGTELWTIEIDSEKPRRLTKFGPCQGDFSWSPDSLELAFASSHDGNWDIYTAPINGGTYSNLTNTVSQQEYEPDWSPDGHSVAFVRSLPPQKNSEVELEIFIQNIQSGIEFQLTNSTTVVVRPKWSPDGSKIAFLSTNGFGSPWYLEIINSDGTGRIWLGPRFDQE